MPKQKTQIVHVNQHVIRNNQKTGSNKPPIIIRGKTGKQTQVYCHEVNLVYNDIIIGKFIYSPNKPLNCGARLWFESSVVQIVPVNDLTGKEENV